MERAENENPGSGGTGDDAPAPFASPDEAPTPVEETTSVHEPVATEAEPALTEPAPAAPDPDDEPARIPAPVAGPAPTFGGSYASSAGGSPAGGESLVQQKPELPVIGAFAGGLVLAILLRRLGS
jgi:hypothetical protein